MSDEIAYALNCTEQHRMGRHVCTVKSPLLYDAMRRVEIRMGGRDRIRLDKRYSGSTGGEVCGILVMLHSLSDGKEMGWGRFDSIIYVLRNREAKTNRQ